MSTKQPPKVIVVDQSLRTSVGHHLEYSLSVREALKEHVSNVEIYANRACEVDLVKTYDLKPLFTETWTEKRKPALLMSMIWALFRILGLKTPLPFLKNTFGEELLHVTQALTSDDHVIVHTLNFAQLLQALQVLDGQNVPMGHFILRQDPGEAARVGLKTLFLKFIFAIAKTNAHLRFYSDTTWLARAFTQLGGIEFQTLPILFDHTPFEFRLAKSANFTVTYLGDGRIEKGYQFLPNIVRKTLALDTSIAFDLQSFLTPTARQDDRLTRAQRDLRDLASRYPTRVKIIEQPLSKDEYANLLLRSDAVLVTYDRRSYRFRSSSVLAQGSAAAKFVIYPSGTSLSDQSARLLAREYRSEEEIPAILATLASTPIPELEKEKAARDFRAAHSKQAFVERLGF